MKLLSLLSLLAAGAATVTAVSVPSEPLLTDLAFEKRQDATPDFRHPRPPRPNCVNGPQSRNCWRGRFDINTDFEQAWPDTGRVAYVRPLAAFAIILDANWSPIVRLDGIEHDVGAGWRPQASLGCSRPNPGTDPRSQYVEMVIFMQASLK